MANTIGFGQGAVNNTNAWGQGAKVGSSFSNTQSIELDGIDDYVDLSSALVFSGEFSLSVWTKPNTLTNNFAQFVGSETTNTDFIAIFSAQALQIKLGNITTYITESVGVNDFVTNQWQHVLVTRDASNNVTAYRNGVQFGSSVVNSGTTNFEVIARRNTTRYSGYLDEIAVWNSDQNANASTIYNSGVPNDISSLSPLSWWRCGDGDTAPTLTDNGSGGNDGTMNNFSTFSTDVPT